MDYYLYDNLVYLLLNKESHAETYDKEYRSNKACRI